MLRRSSRLAFAGGMWVFPGGRVDDADRAGLADDDELGAARRAATREAQEESGLVVASQVLIPYSHWMPPAITPKRFSTWAPKAIAQIGKLSATLTSRSVTVALERKVAGEETTEAAPAAPRAQVIDLMEALKQSLARERTPATSKPAATVASSAKTAPRRASGKKRQ